MPSVEEKPPPSPSPAPEEAAPIREKAPPPPAPALPSSSVPLVFGALGLAASALLPFAPFAWWTGLRYERRCEALGFRPAASGRIGRLLGTTVTPLLAAEGSAILFLAALRRLQGSRWVILDS